MLWLMGSQRVGHDWVTELTELTDYDSKEAKVEKDSFWFEEAHIPVKKSTEQVIRIQYEKYF